MLAAMRAFAKSWFAAGLIGLLMISFAIFGTHDLFRPQLGTWVVRTGDQEINGPEFKRLFENYIAQTEQRYQRKIPVKMAVQQGLDRQVLAEVASQHAMNGLLTQIGVNPSDQLLAEQLRKETAFFDPVSGRFDQKTYAGKLAEAGLTPAKYERYIVSDIANNQFSIGMANGLRAPRTYSALNAIYSLERRDVGYLLIDPKGIVPPSVPSDADLSAFLKANAAQLTLPEFRIISLVIFDPKNVNPSEPVDPEQVKKAYAFKRDTLSAPEARSFIQLPAKSIEQAQLAARRMKAGEDPAVIAKSLGVEVIRYDAKPRTAVIDPAVATVAFSLKPDEISAPIRGSLGFAVLKLLTITPAKVASFESVRPQLEAEIRTKAAATKVYDLSQKYDQAHAGGASLSEAAAKAGVPVITVGPVTVQGMDRRGQPVQGLSEPMLRRAFGLASGAESDVEDAGRGAYFALRVEKIIPPSVPPLAEIKPQLIPYLMRQRMMERIQAKADALSAKLNQGGKLEAVAASFSAKAVTVRDLDRASAESQHQDLGGNFLNAAFSATLGKAFVAPTKSGLAVGVVTAIRPGDPTDIARFTDSQRPEVTLQIFKDIGELTRAAAKQTLQTQSNLHQARVAIGIDPADLKALEEPAKVAAATK